MINWIFAKLGYPPVHFANPANDKWVAWDKFWHFMGHFGFGLVYTLNGAWFGGLGLSILWGFQHEYLDSVLGNGWSWKDIVVNILGWSCGFILGLII